MSGPARPSPHRHVTDIEGQVWWMEPKATIDGYANMSGPARPSPRRHPTDMLGQVWDNHKEMNA